jgi:hypothetical protein
VRRLTAWIGGVAGGVVAYRFWRRHSQGSAEPSPEPPPPPESDDRAEELRAKLAESRTAEPESEEAPAEPEPPAPEEPAAEAESPEERRRRVHEEGRAALDDMQSEDSG